MFNGSFLSSSSRVFFPLFSRVPAREALLVAATLTRDGGGCSSGHVIYLSPYYPPCPRVRGSLSPPTASFVAPSWALPLSRPLRPSFPFFPSLSRSQEETRVRPPLVPLFLFVSPIFHLLPQRLHSALSAPLLSPLYLVSSFIPSPPSFRPCA